MTENRLLIVVLACFFLLAGISVALGTYEGGVTTSSFVYDTACLDCHTVESVDFAAAPVNREVACRVCHYGSHQTMTVETPYGWFRTAESPYADTATLHSSIHSNPKNTTGGCARCHVTASCSACHAAVPHEQHSSTETTPVTLWTTAGGFYNVPTTETFYCGTCHGTLGNDVNRFRVDGSQLCLNCHSADSSGHDPALLAEQHRAAVFMVGSGPDADCAVCHDSVLTFEHENRGYNCTTCHGSGVREEVRFAIENSLRNCDSCHTPIHNNLDNAHISGFMADAQVSCTSCHDNNLITEHNNAGWDCAACHSSTVPAVLNALRSGDGNCSACHDVHPDSDLLHTAPYYVGYEHIDCSTCHGLDVTVEHPSCDTCHLSTRQGVPEAIAAGLVSCDSCHEPVHPANDLTIAHTSLFMAEPFVNCSSCHSDYLPDEHLSYFGYGETAVGYNVFRSTDGSNYTQVGSTLGTMYSSGDLQPDTAYSFKVQAYDQYGLMSDFSSVATAKTAQRPAVSDVVRPTFAEYGDDIDADTSKDAKIEYESYSTLRALTDGRDDRYRDVREKRDEDDWIFVGLDQETSPYTSVKLKIRGLWRDSVSVGEIFVYPYQSDKSNINRSARVTFTQSKPSRYSYQEYTVDVTSAARTMDGYGWMKFRVKPGFNSYDVDFRISEVWIVLENDGAESSYTTPDETLQTSGEDGGNPPTAPGNLQASAANSVQIDLFWEASVAETRMEDSRKTCVLCHGADVRDDVKLAVQSNNRDCAACHSVHSDITAAHTGPALPDTPWDCAGCHSNVLTVEHSTDALLAGNHRLNCNSCHASSVQRVRSAISNSQTDLSNLRCESCHTGTADGLPAVHNTLTGPHVDSIFPTAQNEDCLNCHQNQVEQFKSGNASHHGIFGYRGNAWVNSNSLTSYGLGVKNRGYMKCTDCHSGDHLSGNNYMLKVWQPPSGYSGYKPEQHNTLEGICLTCHRYEVYKTATTDIARYSHEKHSDKGYPGKDPEYYELGCLSCHGDPAKGGVHGNNIYYETIKTTKGTYTVNSYARYFQNGILLGGWRADSESRGMCWTNGTCGSKHDRGKEYDRRTSPASR